jgi:hypothetical protein
MDFLEEILQDKRLWDYLKCLIGVGVENLDHQEHFTHSEMKEK